jgi:ribonucleoside-diphosphate reductase alpha chain
VNYSTKELDKLIYEIAAAYTGSHHDYSRLASSVAISSYHKETNPSFSETMSELHSHGIINDVLIKQFKNMEKKILMKINHNNDYNFDYFAWSSLRNVFVKNTTR